MEISSNQSRRDERAAPLHAEDNLGRDTSRIEFYVRYSSISRRLLGLSLRICRWKTKVRDRIQF